MRDGEALLIPFEDLVRWSQDALVLNDAISPDADSRQVASDHDARLDDALHPTAAGVIIEVNGFSRHSWPHLAAEMDVLTST